MSGFRTARRAVPAGTGRRGRSAGLLAHFPTRGRRMTSRPDKKAPKARAETPARDILLDSDSESENSAAYSMPEDRAASRKRRHRLAAPGPVPRSKATKRPRAARPQPPASSESEDSSSDGSAMEDAAGESEEGGEAADGGPGSGALAAAEEAEVAGDPIKLAMLRLSTQHHGTLCGRDKETARVAGFLSSCLEAQRGGSLYISGQPGCGKTAVVTRVLADLPKRVHVVAINCMRTAAAQIWETLKGFGRHGPTPRAAHKKRPAAKKAQPMLVLFADEVDQLDDSDLCQLYAWPSREGSRLVVIGIANSLNLANDRLQQLTRAGIQPECLPFKPYDKDALVRILSARVADIHNADGTPVLSTSALQLCAAKITTKNGDAREALSICRDAVQQARLQQLRHINNAKSFSRKDPALASLEKMGPSIQLHSLLLLYGACLLRERTPKGIVTVNHVYGQYKRLFGTLQVPPQPFPEALVLLKSNLIGTLQVLRLRGKRSDIEPLTSAASVRATLQASHPSIAERLPARP